MGIFSRLIGNTLWGTKSDDPTMLASVDVTEHSVHTLEQANVVGLVHPLSPQAWYVPIRNRCNSTILQTTGSAVTIGGGAANDTHLIGIHIHTALAGTLTVSGFLDDAGVARGYVYPIGTVGHIPCYGQQNIAGALRFTLSSGTDAARVKVDWMAA